MSWGTGPGRWAVRSTAIKRRGVALSAIAALSTLAATLFPGHGEAQAPDEAWRTLTTEHFRVTFPEHLEDLGRRAADRAERAWSELESHFIDGPEDRVDLLVTDHTDASNGFAQVTPSNRITVFARPAVDALALGFADEWLELVITHELAHIVHLDHVVNPIGRLGRAIFGRVPSEWPLFPGLGTPRWVIEGLATWYESRLTEAGRTRGSFHDMQVRTAALEGRFESIGQASSESPVWPGGNRAYAYGSLFFDFLLERHGEDAMVAFADAVAGQWIPYRLDAAGSDAFGVSLTDEWQAWRASLDARIEELDAELEANGPITEPEALTTDARWAFYPEVSPGGRWLAYTRSDGYSDMQIRLIDLETGESRVLGRTNQLATFSWIDDERLLVSQLEFHDPYRVYRDLYVFDLDGGQHRLTEGARLAQPSVGPDGGWAVAVREGGGTNELVRFDLASGDVNALVGAEPDVHWALPSISPNGRWIAATRFEPDARHDLVIVDAGTGELVDRVTDDRALDLAPRWSPDGRLVVWASDRSAILNVYGVAVDPSDGSAGRPRLLTNLRTGASYPSIGPAAEWLYMSGYHVDGWQIERIPLRTSGNPAAPLLDDRFVAENPPPERRRAGGDVEDYDPWPTLRPRYWELSYEDAVETPPMRVVVEADTIALPRRELLGPAIGFQTSGNDLVRRHFYSTYLRLTTSRVKLDGGLSYSFAGLGNPIVSVSASQSYADGGQQIGTRSDTSRDTLYVLDRERFVQARLDFRAPNWRWNRSVSVSGGMVWVHRQLLGGDLEPTSEFRLNRPQIRLLDGTVTLNLNSTRSHSFQMGVSQGLGLQLLGRVRQEVSLPDSLRSVAGADRSTAEVVARVRGGIPLWRAGYARHVIAFRGAAALARGPGAGPGHYRVGGATGRPEPVTGLELFGGTSYLFPVRGYEPSSRFGSYAWSASAEYRIPLWMIHQGLRAWPLHFDRAMASVFFDAGNAWGPDLYQGFLNPLRTAVASAGAEVSLETLTLFDTGLTLRGGVAFPLVSAGVAAGEPRFYVRVGLPY